MRRILLVSNIFLIIFVLSLVFVDVAFAEGEDGNELSKDLLTQFAPVLAATVAIERLLQLVRSMVSPNPEKGPLARKSKALRYYTIIGGVVLGLILTLMSGDLRLLELAGTKVNLPIVDTILTAITIGMGTEFVHEIIKVLGEGKRALRVRGKA